MQGRYVTDQQLRVLRLMQEDEVYDGELVCDNGAWYVGEDAVDPRVASALLRKVLVRDVSNNSGILRFALNAEGRTMLQDPTYKPQIYSVPQHQLEADFDALDSESEHS